MATLNGQQIIALMTKGRLTKTQKKTINQNGVTVKPDEGYDAFSEVTIDVPMSDATTIDTLNTAV